MFFSYLIPKIPNKSDQSVWGDGVLTSTIMVHGTVQSKRTSQATGVVLSSCDLGFFPRTALGKRLTELRAEAIALGMKLLSEEEVLQEVNRRRREMSGETNLY